MFQSPMVRWIRAVAISTLVFPLVTFAQGLPTIVPEACRDASAATKCGVCQIGQLAQNILNTGIYIAVFLSAILFAYAGWNYLTAGGDPGKAGEARKVFWNVGVGLILILGAWLIVDLIIKMLAGSNVKLMPWNKVCELFFQHFLA